MFESAFGKLGTLIVKHRKKIIIFWIIFFIIMAPFSIITFQQTSYDLSSQVITQNSMSSKADTLLAAQFSHHNSSQTTVIVISNADINNNLTKHQIMSLQHALENNKTLKAYNVQVSSIYSITYKMLLKFSNSTKLLLAYTYAVNNNAKKLFNLLNFTSTGYKQYMTVIAKVANATKHSYFQLFNNTNISLTLIFGVPNLYTSTFINNINYGMHEAEYIAYQYTVKMINAQFASLPYYTVGMAYFNNFTYYFNNTLHNAKNASVIERQAISYSLYHSNFSTVNLSIVKFWQVLGLKFNTTNFSDFYLQQQFVVAQIIDNFDENSTLTNLINNNSRMFVWTLINSTNIEGFTVGWTYYTMNATVKKLVNTYFGSNYLNSIWNMSSTMLENYVCSKTAKALILNNNISALLTTLNISARNFVNRVINANSLTDITVTEIYNYTIAQFKHDPLIHIGPDLFDFLVYLNDSSNTSQTVDNVIDTFDFSTYPLIPGPYTYHNFVGYDNHTSIIYISLNSNATPETLTVINALSIKYIKSIPFAKVYVGGSQQTNTGLNKDVIHGMKVALTIGIILSIFIVGLFFRSPVAAIFPMLMFTFTALISLGINGLIYRYILHTTISFITPMLMMILILGLTTDYSVYLMARFRREIMLKSKNPLNTTAKWAGHAVFTSGITVILSYVVLWIANVPLFSDSGFTNAIGIIVVVVATETLLIAIFSLLGKRIFWPKDPIKMKKVNAEKLMVNIAILVRKHRNKVIAIFLALSFIALFVYVETPTSMDVFDLIPQNSGLQAVRVVNTSFHGDMFFRGYVIVQFPTQIYTNHRYNNREMHVVTAIEQAMLNNSGIATVYGPTYPFGAPIQLNRLVDMNNLTRHIYTTQIYSYFGKDHKTVVIYFKPAALAWERSSMSAVISLKTTLSNVLSNKNVTAWYIGGMAQVLTDAYTYTYHAFLSILPILIITVFGVLLIQLSSVFTPIRLIFMVIAAILMALSIVYSLIYYIFQLPVLVFLPMFVFITLLAVGLDYDIFMITRVREAVFKGRTEEEAIATSLKENGGIIIVLGLILTATFSALYFTNIGIAQEMGMGLAIGVLVDTFISWPFFVPAVMLLLKKYNWWPSKMSSKGN